MNEDDLRALVEQSFQLSELVKHPGWEILVDYLDATTKQSKLAVLNGNVPDFERYKQLTGEHAGIQRVLDAPMKVQQMVLTERARRAEASAPDAA